jgi:hypothetical protein
LRESRWTATEKDKYTFGDNDLASFRLRQLAQLCDPETRESLQRCDLRAQSFGELRVEAICASLAAQRERHIPSFPSLTGCVWGTFGKPPAVKGGPQIKSQAKV